MFQSVWSGKVGGPTVQSTHGKLKSPVIIKSAIPVPETLSRNLLNSSRNLSPMSGGLLKTANKRHRVLLIFSSQASISASTSRSYLQLTHPHRVDHTCLDGRYYNRQGTDDGHQNHCLTKSRSRQRCQKSPLTSRHSGH